jgi:lysozyme
MSKISNLEDQLRRDEGEKLSAYQDNLGYWTIGVGRLIDVRKGGGLTKEESAYLLNNDICRKSREVKDALPWFGKLDEVRQGVLLNMAFQLGTEGMLKFKNTLAMIEAGRYEAAAESMRNSLWANQTPARADRLATQMRTGAWQ